MQKRKRGAQAGNRNAVKTTPDRVVLSVKGEILAPYFEEFKKQHGYPPSEEIIKQILLESLHEPQVLHLRVDTDVEHASEVRRIIERHLGSVQTAYCLADWSPDREEAEKRRTVYYQRLLSGWNPYNPSLEPWEDRGVVPQERINHCIEELEKYPHCWNIRTTYARS